MTNTYTHTHTFTVTTALMIFYNMTWKNKRSRKRDKIKRKRDNKEDADLSGLYKLTTSNEHDVDTFGVQEVSKLQCGKKKKREKVGDVCT